MAETTVKEKTLLDRVRAVWAVVELLVEEAIIGAEGYEALDSGEEKRAYVIDNVIDALQELERQKDLLPGWAELLAFKAVDFALPWIVERVFDRLDSDNKVNVPA